LLERIILHIGAEKTGSTTIQEFLWLNRELLKSHGVYFPGSERLRNHSYLAVNALEEANSNKWRRNFANLVNDDAKISNTVKPVLNRQDQIILDAPLNSIRTVIYSSEHLHSQLQSQEDVNALMRVLPSCASYKIILYIRRQDLTALSLYSTFLKGGGVGEFRFPSPANRSMPYRYNYLQGVELWSSVFGRAALTVRLFDSKEWLNSDLVRDFCDCADIPWDSKYTKPEHRNQSVDLNGFYVLNCLNKVICNEPNLLTSAQVIKLRRMISSIFISGPRYKPSRESALLFYNYFKADNEKLKKMIFPDRIGPLFDEDFDDYPLCDPRRSQNIDADIIVEKLFGVVFKLMNSNML
jgi:hypothetical protein